MATSHAQSKPLFTLGPYDCRHRADDNEESWDIYAPSSLSPLASIPCSKDRPPKETQANAWLFAAAYDLYQAGVTPGLDTAHDALTRLLDDDDAGNDAIRDAAFDMCCILTEQRAAREKALAKLQPDTSEEGFSIDALLTAERKIAVIWSIADVKDRRPDLSEDQTWEVLQRCQARYDTGHELNSDVIEQTAYDLFGTGNAQRVARCQAVLAEYSDEFDMDASLVDFLTDAMHWCTHYGRPFAQLLRVAQEHFTVENGE